MNLFVKWMRRVLQVDQLEEEFFKHEDAQGSELLGIRDDLLQIKQRLSLLERQPRTTHQHQTFHADRRLRRTVDCLCAELEGLKTEIATKGLRNGSRAKRPKS
jgi:uncharacterized protein YxjI